MSLNASMYLTNFGRCMGRWHCVSFMYNRDMCLGGRVSALLGLITEREVCRH